MEKTIKIMVGQGIVQSVEGLPDGYQYEVIECDKYGEPIDNCEDCTIPDPEEKECTDCDVPLKEKECPQCHMPMVLADEDVEGQGKTWLCQECKIHMALDIDETVEDAIRQTYEESETPPCPECGSKNTWYKTGDIKNGGCNDCGWQL